MSTKVLDIQYLLSKGYSEKQMRQLTKLYLGNHQIEIIDKEAFEKSVNLIELFLNNNKLTTIYGDLFKELTQLTKLWLHNNQIENIDKKAFERCVNLTKLSLSKNKLTIIDSDLFKALTQLSKLWLHDNQIERIDTKAFEKCVNLIELTFSNNKLTIIDSELFKELTQLTKLWLHDNQIEIIDKKVFEKCVNLTELTLSNNKLTIIDGDLFKELSLLTKLSLHDNKIDIIYKKTFQKCVYLTHLTLSNNKLTIIDGDLFKELTQLTKLWLHDNQIERIDQKAFEKCVNITELCLDNNKLKIIDYELFLKLTHLSKLSLSDNQIERIDKKAFKKCFNIKELYLDNNKLKIIDSDLFKELTKLTKLWLYNNQIEIIDKKAFEKCVTLTEFTFSNNKLAKIDSKLLLKLTKLSKFSLSDNQIEIIDKKAFKKCFNITELCLDNNKLKIIDSDLFKELTQLSKLWLHDNQIERIDQKAFEKCVHLTELYLNNNKLKIIDSDLFVKLTKLTKLLLNDNQIERIDKKAFEKCVNITELSLNNNKLTILDGDLFKELTQLTELDLSDNFLKEIQRNNFVHLLKLSVIDLSNNCIFGNLNLGLYCHQSLVNLNFSLNNIQKIILDFRSHTNSEDNQVQSILINISSNNFKSLSDIRIQSKNQNSAFMINARFNSIEIIELDFERFKIQFQNLKIDLSKNPCAFEISQNEIYKDNFIVQIQPKYPNRYKSNINFGSLKESYSSIDGLRVWDDISPFSIITGKNGVGKSTFLKYIKDFLYNEFYQKQLIKKKGEKIDNEEFYYIPVIYKMHDTIKAEMISFEELEKNTNNFINEFFLKRIDFHKIMEKKLTLLEANNLMTWCTLDKVKNIFTVDSIDKLILMFKINIDRINQHLSGFKYKIEIKNGQTIESSSITFISKYNSKIKIEGSSSLSPGEQLILLFRLWEFALTRYEIPHTPVLLLDEPDAHLHPQAVHEFVRILEKLSQAGAQIIMTTHNPTTVSLVKKENLYCMKSDQNGAVSIEKAKLKTDVIRELTNNLILVNEPYRVVLVEGAVHDTYLPEPEYETNERDALFYRFVNDVLSESIVKNNDFAEVQLVFKSLSGHDNIFDLLKSLDNGKMYQDHYAIIDNDNFFQICNNQTNEIERYYANRTKRRFNLLRHSLENYILDPINLFVYLNFYAKQALLGESRAIRVNETSLEQFHQRVFEKIQISAANLQKNDLMQIIKLTDFDKNKEFYQSVVTLLGRDLVEYLTQLDSFEYRVFSQKEVLNNYLTPIFRYVGNSNYFTKQDIFCSVNFLKNARANLSTSNVIKKNDPRLGMLAQPGEEKSAIKKEFEEVKQIVNDIYCKSDFFQKFENLGLMESKKLSETYQGILKNKEFKVWMQSERIRDQNNLNSRINEFIDWIFRIGDESIKKLLEDIDKHELELYIKSKFQIDELLIAQIKKYLLKTVDCCFFEHENQVFEYPLVFYKLRGHYLEEVIYDMFFNMSGKYETSKLINDLLRDECVMKSCGYMVPNELPEIFKRIRNVVS